MRKAKRPHGQLRQSQVVTTFGPGAMLELPDYSVLVGGLEHWSPGGDEIVEPRLTQKLMDLLAVPALRLHAPPPDQDDLSQPQTGITGWQFPEWFITQDVQRNEENRLVRSRMLVHRKQLFKNRFVDDNKVKHDVVPVRFVRACRSGHIGDILWRELVHGGKSDCRRQLWIDERGTSGDLSEVFVRCECEASISMAQAAKIQDRMLGHCNGSRPWLGPFTNEKCGEPNRLLIRTASNAYFTQTMSVISLPDRNEEIKEVVTALWDFLEIAESADDVKRERKRQKVRDVLEGYSDDEVWAEIQNRTGVGGASDKSVKELELETLIAAQDELGNDKPYGNFFARSLPKTDWNKPWMDPLEKVVLVHRLREVVALAGFTRFEAVSPGIDGELDMGVQRAALAREISWLPAIENRGEGIFLQFRNEAIEEWVQRADVASRGAELIRGFDMWLEDHSSSSREFPGLPYLMLHSFSHMLVTSMSLECGYPASSIRERIYAVPNVGYGILLFTGTTDAEGTLGGLVQSGRRIHEHVRGALTMAELCSNDPVCAQHESTSPHERRFLHGAACHGCLLIAETSCEQHNEFLDRSLVVPTVANRGIEFFPMDKR